jgi:hypothetical protein
MVIVQYRKKKYYKQKVIAGGLVANTGFVFRQAGSTPTEMTFSIVEGQDPERVETEIRLTPYDVDKVFARMLEFKERRSVK